jgi:HK97 family phage major capsid protein
MTLKEFRAKRARLIANARSKFDEITPDTPEARAAEIEGEFNSMMAEAAKLERQISNLERLERAEADLRNGDPRRPLGENAGGAAIDEPVAVDYREAFHALMCAGGDVHAMDAEARAALQARNDEFRAQVAGTDAAGGFLVPDEAHTAIVKAMAAWGPMYDDGFATVLNTNGGGTLPIPGVDDTAGRAEKNTSEGAALTDDGGKDVTFTKSTLGDFLYDTEWLRVSIQLATSGMVGMEGLLGDLLGERLGRTANDVLTVGTGTGEPLGIVTGAGVGKTVAATGAVTADEILELLHSIDPAYRRSPKFGLMFNDNTLLALSKLKDGQGNYLLGEDGDGVSRLRIGRVSARYTINQAMANIGANNRSMIAGDMGKYFVRKIGNIVIGTDRGKEFWPGFGVAGYTRLDGAVADTKAIKALVHPAA